MTRSRSTCGGSHCFSQMIGYALSEWQVFFLFSQLAMPQHIGSGLKFLPSYNNQKLLRIGLTLFKMNFLRGDSVWLATVVFSQPACLSARHSDLKFGPSYRTATNGSVYGTETYIKPRLRRSLDPSVVNHQAKTSLLSPSIHTLQCISNPSSLPSLPYSRY